MVHEGTGRLRNGSTGADIPLNLAEESADGDTVGESQQPGEARNRPVA